MTTVVKATSIILDSPRDWVQWHAIVKNAAKSKGVFEYIDVDATTPPPQPIKPIDPKITDVKPDATVFSALSPEQKEDYKFLANQYRTRLDSYKTEKKELGDIYTLIQDTIALHYKPYIIDESTPYKVLKALKKRIAPTERAQRLKLARDYHALKKNSRGQSVEKWLSL